MIIIGMEYDGSLIYMEEDHDEQPGYTYTDGVKLPEFGEHDLHPLEWTLLGMDALLRIARFAAESESYAMAHDLLTSLDEHSDEGVQRAIAAFVEGGRGTMLDLVRISRDLRCDPQMSWIVDRIKFALINGLPKREGVV